jgi:hypothetical protein
MLLSLLSPVLVHLHDFQSLAIVVVEHGSITSTTVRSTWCWWRAANNHTQLQWATDVNSRYWQNQYFEIRHQWCIKFEPVPVTILGNLIQMAHTEFPGNADIAGSNNASSSI